MPAEELKRLRETIAVHDYHYYVLDAPVISDEEYDALMRRLRELEQAYPHLVTLDSPTQRVSGVPSPAFKKVQHRGLLLSLGNAESQQELEQFAARANLLLGHPPAEYTVEWKYDGLSIAVIYENGALTRGATRGDGVVGEDVTANVRTIKQIPLRLNGFGWPTLLEIRGEVFITKSAFADLVAQGVPLKTPRNAAAGSLRQKDPRVTASRQLQVYFYAITAHEGTLPFHTQAEMIETLRDWGLPTGPLLETYSDVTRLGEACDAHWNQRHQLPFEVDGFVVKINGLAEQESCGHAGRDPRGSIARKYPANEVETRVERIEVQVGRTGQLTPVAFLTPVVIDGAEISFVSLHNADFIRDLDLRVGDKVRVRRAGHVIPEVVAVCLDQRTGAEEIWRMPDTCPLCGTAVQRVLGEAAVRCPKEDCLGRRQATLQYAVGREVLDVAGLGPSNLAKLLSTKAVEDVADLFSLDANRLMAAGLGAKTAQNIAAALGRARQADLTRLLRALNIRHVAAQTAEDLASHFGSLDAIAAAQVDDLCRVSGVGPIVAQSLVDYFASDSGRQLVTKLKDMGIQGRPAVSQSGVLLAGKTFVITGTLSRSRNEIESQIKRLGGLVKDSVGRGTHYLIAGDSPGSKLTKAKELGVAILDQAGLELLLSGAVPDGSSGEKS